MSENDIVVEKLSKSFGATEALKGVSFRVKNHEFFAIIGPSGCGKTTLLKCLVGLEHPDSGAIHIGGKDVVGIPVHKRRIGLIFQNFALFPHLTTFKNIAFGLETQKLPPSEIRKSVEEIIHIAGLEGIENKKPNEISVGQQQRVATARSMVTRPNVLLYDEPLANVDYDLQKRMLVEIKQLHRKAGLTSIYVTHNQEQAMILADRIMVMNLGHIEQIGTPDEVYSNPSSMFVARFVGEINMVKGKVASIGRGITTVDTAIGKFTSTAKKDLSKDQELAYAIRPERIFIGEKGRNCKNRVTAEMVDKVYEGADVDLLLNLGKGTNFKVSLQAEDFDPSTVNSGEKTIMGWNPEDAILLDKPSVIDKIDIGRAILGA